MVSAVVILFEEHETRLDSDVENVPPLPQDFEAVRKNGPWTVAPGVVHVQVAGHPGDVPSPGQDSQRFEVGDAHDIRILRALGSDRRRQSPQNPRPLAPFPGDG